jgi:hypothetical protein
MALPKIFTYLFLISSISPPHPSHLIITLFIDMTMPVKLLKTDNYCITVGNKRDAINIKTKRYTTNFIIFLLIFKL